MATIQELKDQYVSLDLELPTKSEEAIDPSYLLTFQYEYPNQQSLVEIDTDEFTAVCPWTGLPDYGILTISYVPNDSCIELKSLKYYLISFRNVGIYQEDVTSRIFNDLNPLLEPEELLIKKRYSTRGGIDTTCTINSNEQKS